MEDLERRKVHLDQIVDVGTITFLGFVGLLAIYNTDIHDSGYERTSDRVIMGACFIGVVLSCMWLYARSF